MLLNLEISRYRRCTELGGEQGDGVPGEGDLGDAESILRKQCAERFHILSELTCRIPQVISPYWHFKGGCVGQASLHRPGRQSHRLI